LKPASGLSPALQRTLEVLAEMLGGAGSEEIQT